LKLTVVSYLSALDDEFEEIALRAVPSPGHQFRRCQTRAGLFETVAFAAPARSSITRLDIQGHGAPGGMNIGEELLVRVPRDPHWEAMLRLLPYLAEGAELRLLGCHVGVGEPGRQLLMELAMLLCAKQIIVLAATDTVCSRDFGPDGFRTDREGILLREGSPRLAAAVSARRAG